MPKAKPWDSKTARLAAEKSVEARQRKSNMTPEERAIQAISGSVDKLAKELVQAALGQGDFADLKLELRVAALKTALEYGLGKPTTRAVPDDKSETVVTPDSLFAKD